MNQAQPMIYGVNPVLESLRSNQNCLNKIFLLQNRRGKEIEMIRSLARESHTVLLTANRVELDRMARTTKHQGIVAILSSEPYSNLDDILRIAKAGKVPPFLVILDEVEDPRNLGAIIRTADAVGVHGVIIPERRAAGLTAVVSKASAGALSHLPVARVVNLSTVIDRLKEEGLWIVGVDSGAPMSYDQYDFKGPIALVVGSEGKGIRRKILDRCDQVVSMPMSGHVSSLNVSVALGIVAYEVLRQRRKE
ncbi:MAG: 23S rRNA (guanosine(2251)-2'-O)-methyltransferase RlmB [Nitrospira sp.]|nr:23S rRNA (guanosine(2251)-2'-O)-methyltransferase RlmB [Candidatus Manganitrophaceae bacterium]HIL35001.1 23S rRNA (guanosine(2251)-2'-O)-methyltransferase RlmB [Candidatus Manganitrophaceae bacterium]